MNSALKEGKEALDLLKRKGRAGILTPAYASHNEKLDEGPVLESCFDRHEKYNDIQG